MSNSNITKQAYASSLRELMKVVPFEKITVAQICEKCGLTRKSFYYHFKDKYDLVTWIFDQELIKIVKEMRTSEEFVGLLCNYLYTNKEFYTILLRVEGQNSFSEHLEEVLLPLVQSWLEKSFEEEEVHPLYVDFIADGFVNSVKRWLLERDSITPEEFVYLLKNLVYKIADNYS